MSELERLRKENASLRKQLACAIAEYIWVEGGNYGKIEREIKRFGYKLDWKKTTPKIIPI